MLAQPFVLVFFFVWFFVFRAVPCGAGGSQLHLQLEAEGEMG